MVFVVQCGVGACVRVCCVCGFVFVCLCVQNVCSVCVVCEVACCIIVHVNVCSCGVFVSVYKHACGVVCVICVWC